MQSGERPGGQGDRGARGTAAPHVSGASPMNDHVLHVAECHGLAEPPLTRLYDPYGLPTNHFICQDCGERVIHPDELRDVTGEGG
jgi:hypothetical protein